MLVVMIYLATYISQSQASPRRILAVNKQPVLRLDDTRWRDPAPVRMEGGGLTTSRQELQLLHHHLSYCRSFWYVRQQQRSLSAAHGHQLYLLPLSMKGTQAGEGVEGCSLWFNPKKGG